MKKRIAFLTVLMMLVCTPLGAVSTYVDNSIKMLVNGSPVSAPVVMNNGSVFVPLRFMSEQLNAQVNWDSKTRTVTVKKEGSVFAKPSPGQVVINGTDEFKNTIGSSPSLLKSKAPDKHKIITSNVKAISQGSVNTSIAKMDISAGVCIVDLTVFESYSNRAKFSTSDKKIFLAGVLVHESHHAMMFNQGLFGYANAPISAFDAEVLAHAYTRQAIKKLGASKQLMSLTSLDYIVDTNYQGAN